MIWLLCFNNYLKINIILENKVKLNSNSNHEIFFVKKYKKNTKE